MQTERQGERKGHGTVQPTPQDHRTDGSAGADTPPADAPMQRGAALDLGVLDTLAERPPHEHAAVYDEVHAQLQHALSEIDDA